MNSHFFEGSEYRRIPKHEWDLEKGAEDGRSDDGSVSTTGWAVFLLSTSVFVPVDSSAYLTTELPRVDDIPQTAANI